MLKHAPCLPLLAIAIATLASLPTAQSVVRGVNLGGWLLTEQWYVPLPISSTAKTTAHLTECTNRITPTLYGYRDLEADEWGLCNVLGKKDCLATLKVHWR